MKRWLLVLGFLLISNLTLAQTTRTYTLTFNHDGLYTESYVAVVDGVRVPITPTCTGEGDARLCTSPLQLTYSVEHKIEVIATGIFGEGVSLPFECKLPKIPNNTKVGR